MDNHIKAVAIKNMIWKFMERCFAQGVSFLVSLILARILYPEDYGVIAIVTVFIAIFNVFVDSGMANALIQKKDSDSLDFSSVFYFNIVFSVILYGIIYFLAPYIAGFYQKPQITVILRVLGITLIVSGVKNIQQAYVSKNLEFKKFFYSTMIGTVLSSIIGIGVAFMGGGIWALVLQSISNTVMDTIVLWVTVKWRPTKEFSLHRIKRLFGFGSGLLISSVIDVVYNNSQQMLIGRVFTPADLAFFNRGQSFPNLVVANINTSIDSVLLPVMSQVQDNIYRVKSMTRNAIKTSSYIMLPAMVGLACIADPLVNLVLTEKWAGAIPYLRIYCIVYAFYPIHTANLNAIKALGRSDIFLKLEIIKKIIGIGLLVIAFRYGVMAIAYSLVVDTVVCSFANAFPNKKLLNYSYLDQIKDIFPSLAISLVMFLILYPITFCDISNILKLVLQVVVGVISYVVLSIVSKNDVFHSLLGMIKRVRVS